MTAAIGKHSVVEIHYTLKNAAGEVLDTSADGEPLMYLHGTHGLIQGLENELLGKKVGDSFKAVIPPALAYGEIDPELIHSIDKSLFRASTTSSLAWCSQPRARMATSTLLSSQWKATR
jgi:FKBP-type peptidyl-prolyl cis-trans isomerase 2